MYWFIKIRKWQLLCWNTNANMLTSKLLIRTWCRPTWRSHHLPPAAREQLQSIVGRESLAYLQLLSAGVSGLKLEMPTVCPNLCLPLLLHSFVLHPIPLFSIPLSFVSWPYKSSIPHIGLIPIFLPSSHPGRSLLVKDSAVLRVKMTHPARVLFASDRQTKEDFGDES